MYQDELRKRVDIAQRLSREAGAILMQTFGAVSRISLKGSVDLVTEADEAAEACIRSGVAKAFKQDRILAEETGASGSGDGAWCWVIDPLDGTTNFVHGVRRFAVSIGITFEDVPVGGVIYNPITDETFHAMQGCGAWRDSEPIRVSQSQFLRESLLVTGFPYDRGECAAELTGIVSRALEQARGLRRFGAACLDLVDVAQGTFDGYWEPRLCPWDMAAGLVLVQEAGGQVSRYGGLEFSLTSPDLIASNGLIHSELVDMVEGGVR